MANEISYRDIPELLVEIRKGRVGPVYLLFGDEFLYKSAFKSLLDALIPQDHQHLNYESIDGATANVYEIIEHLNTFPLIPSAKVIAVHDTIIFYSAAAVDDFLRRSREAFERQDLKESVQHLLLALSAGDVSLDDVKDGNWRKIFDERLKESFGASFNTQAGGEKDAGGVWLDQVIAYCVQKKMEIPVDQDDAEVLNDAILSGYPETNHLVLTTDFVDKRRRLYKTVNKIGVVIDCSVPKGDRKADKRQQQQALKSHMKESLKKVGKTMAPGGFEALYEKIGTGMRGFSSELDKLITFVGERKEVLPSDVETVSKRTKQDPIYEMTNAIAERNTQGALFFLDSLLKDNVHQLQILAAVTNQIRKLILAKDFIRARYGSGWREDLSYQAFQKTVLPELEKREPDLLTSKAHPYAIYVTLKQTNNYTLEDLIKAMEVLLDTDIRLKSSGQDAKMVLEHALMRICGA